MDPPTQTHWLAKPALVVLVCYWLALVAGTHWPYTPEVIDIGPSDKALHLTAFFGLALLACLNWSLRRPFGWPAWIVVVAVLAMYGAVDELTQTPVGRDANLYDWAADCIGTLAGVGLFVAIRAATRRAQ